MLELATSYAAAALLRQEIWWWGEGRVSATACGRGRAAERLTVGNAEGQGELPRRVIKFVLQDALRTGRDAGQCIAQTNAIANVQNSHLPRIKFRTDRRLLRLVGGDGELAGELGLLHRGKWGA